MKFTNTLRAALLGLAVAGLSTAAMAQSYPSRPVKLVVGFSPGGTIDVVARIIGEHLATKLGQPFVVENRTGANGMIAAESVARAEADGYSVFVSNSSTITLNPTLFKDLKYKPQSDFAPVTTVISVPLILAVNPEHPQGASIKSLKDLVALAKSKPGEVPYGSAGNGNITHLAFELLSQKAGIQMIHVPYRGAAAAQTAAFTKEVTVIFDTLSAVPHVKAGKLRALAVSSAQRLPALPDVPTVAELGFPGFDISFWVGIFLPKATPAEIVDLLSREIIAATNVPAVRAKLEPQGSILTQSPAQFAAKIKEETDALAEVVAKGNIKAD